MTEGGSGAVPFRYGQFVERHFDELENMIIATRQFCDQADAQKAAARACEGMA